MKRLVVLVAVVGGLAAAACTPVKGPTPAPWSEQRARCEAGIASTVADLAWRATAPIACSTPLPGATGLAGGYYPASNTALVFYGDYERSVGSYRDTAAHELGHAWDHNILGSAQRARFAEIRGGDWHEEDYANAFAALTPSGGGRPVTIAYSSGGAWLFFPPFTEEQHHAICAEGLVPC